MNWYAMESDRLKPVWYEDITDKWSESIAKKLDDDFMKDISGNNLVNSTDARSWAKEFCKTYKNIYNKEIDEGWMITWFANAIMAGIDETVNKEKKKDKYVYILSNGQTGEVIATYSQLPTQEQCNNDYSLHLGKDLEWAVRNVIYKEGHGASWNCILEEWKINSLNRIHTNVKISDLKLYNN